jgi:hypothetical protein
MGTVTSPESVKLITALMGHHSDDLATARTYLTDQYGTIDTESATYDFTFTDYYTKEMGAPLIKQFISFTELIDPERLADIKLSTNVMEEKFSRPDGQPGRGVNIDPGYLTPAKLVLATTKDYSHRIYLKKGIYAEVTLEYRHQALHAYPWTYPDYKTDSAFDYFLQVRHILMENHDRTN